MLVQVTASVGRLATSTSRGTDVVLVRFCDSTSHFADDPLQLPQLVSALAHFVVNEIVDRVDTTIDGLGVSVE